MHEDMNARARISATTTAAVVLCFFCAIQTLEGAGQSASPQSATQTQARPAPPPEMRVDINHASIAELLKVPGMTASWAGRIVRYRPYRTKQDLLDHGILPSDVYDRIKDYVIAHRDKQ
jgi:DNA uptake protein ComE-like DNA-binding protein